MSNFVVLSLKEIVDKGHCALLSDNIVFFEDEWRDKPEICKSIISAKNKKIDLRVFARECTPVIVKSKEAKGFFDTNHIAGHTKSFFNLGLVYDKEIVSILSFRKPFTRNHKGCAEIARFCSALDTVVVGGFSKLLKHSLPHFQDFGSILTYADLRFGDGKTYKKCGFEFVGKTKPDYFYTDGEYRYNRFRFRAQNGLSEKEVALKAKVHRVYGRGSNVFKMKV